jgi:hypothetical protein
MIADCWLRDRIGIVVIAPVLAEQRDVMPTSELCRVLFG